MIYVLSGGTKLFAAIGVTYPEGSTCTCTNGTKTLKAKNTSGQWVFAIPEAGTWTVTAADGTNTKSQSVSITKEGQFESVNLATYYLFKSGVGLQNGHTLTTLYGKTTLAEDNSSIALANSSQVSFDAGYINPLVDVTEYSTLYIDYEFAVASSNRRFGLLASTSAPTSFTKDTPFAAVTQLSAAVNTRTTEAVDISTVSGERYIGWYIPNGLTIYNIYFE